MSLTNAEIDALCNVKEYSGYERGDYPPVPVQFVVDIGQSQKDVEVMYTALELLIFQRLVVRSFYPDAPEVQAVRLTDKGFDVYDAL